MKEVILVLIAFAITFSQDGSIQKIAELKKEVIVRWDERSVPYIEAQNESDLYFVQGYVTASDRLWQMDLMRRVASGRTAEIFGQSALEQDKYWRKFGFAAIAEKSLEFMDEKLRLALENYAKGVNAYIKSLNDETLPVEFKVLKYKPEEWKPADSILIGKILAEALSTTWRQDLLYAKLKASLSEEKFAEIANVVTPYDVILFGKDSELIAESGASIVPSERILKISDKELELRRKSLEMIGLYAEGLAASNNWVVSGKRTLDGKPILANDPHLPPTAPGIWYMIHLSLPDQKVAGVTFPGVPGVVLGHNDFIAWGATNVGPDVQDLYVENFNEEGKYQTPNGWQAPVVRREEIRYRISPFSDEVKSDVYEFLETRNGVIILEEDGKKYALKWTAREPSNQEFEAFYYLNRARSWEEFKAALKRYGGPMQNFVYADAKGNIGWYAAGRVPIRRKGDGRLPYKGSESDGDWIGYIPFEELPNLYNPVEGFIVTANQRIVGTSYKYRQIVREIAPPWRARRIYELLKANTKLTMNDVRDIQYDVFNIPLSNLARRIISLSAASEETLNLLRGWDGKMKADSKAAALVNEISNCLASKIAEENKPLTSYIVQLRLLPKVVEEESKLWLPKKFTSYQEFLKACDLEARKKLDEKFGRDNWVWGKVFVANFSHPFAAVKDPFGISKQFEVKFENVDGSSQTPNVGSFVSMRFITMPGNWDKTRLVIPLGQSGDPRSPFWKDQFDAWRTGVPITFPFTKEAVLKTTKRLAKFQPD
ncbi:MAG: penicillin acylase family protein [Pyrinomonadaceae bacterium]|nr:penicillin acylase family protein [Pyrinomonadaceae bacterium]MCX7640127.1 penicillin acylase family protein [Pyrinomonadaceae bacterium]MDW8303285.1 penicillin acylase family protein [Acidobacteriota bacterium]